MVFLFYPNLTVVFVLKLTLSSSRDNVRQHNSYKDYQ